MKGFTNRWSVLAVATLFFGFSACGGGDSKDKVSPPPPVAETGVVSVGVITGFGSVYLNGARYDTSGASVLIDDEAAVESGLKVGQYVELKGHSQGAEYHADVIRYHNVIEGPIASINVGASSFVAMGQTVLVTAATSLGDDMTPSSIEGLAVDDVVEVSGIVSSLGVIEATRFDIKPDGGPFDVTGVCVESRAGREAVQYQCARRRLLGRKHGRLHDRAAERRRPGSRQGLYLPR